MTDAVTADRPLRKDAARNRQLLIDAARNVFAERGLEASLDDVAHAAGVGVGTAYRHFANKHELATAVFGEAVDEFAARAEGFARLPDPWTGIVAFVEDAAGSQTRDRGLREVLMGGHDPEAMERVSERITAPLTTLVERAKQAGQLGAHIEATDLGVIVMMLCTVADALADESPELWRRYLPMLLTGLRSPEEPAVDAVDTPTLRRAMACYKQRLGH